MGAVPFADAVGVLVTQMFRKRTDTSASLG